MKLSTRIILAMAVLVSATAIALGYTTYRAIASVVIPGELDNLQAHTEQISLILEAAVTRSQADIRALSRTPPITGIIRARKAGGVDPMDGSTESQWRARLEQIFVARLEATEQYTQLRYIGLSDGGREIVRVDRSGEGGAVRVVASEDLQTKMHRDYFQETISLEREEIYVSELNLNREHNELEVPRMPVLRTATPVYTAEEELFGFLIINIDMRPVFKRMRTMKDPEASIYLVNETGDYLMHPDSTREFGFDLGFQARIQDEFPALRTFASDSDMEARLLEMPSSGKMGVACIATPLGGGRVVYVLQCLPYSVMMAAGAPVLQATMLTGIIALCFSLALGILVARSLTRPLADMSRSVTRFGLSLDSGVDLPVNASGEIGVLAQAFSRSTDEVRRRTDDLQKEVDEHRKTSAALEESVERLRLFNAVVESTDQGIFTLDDHGLINGWNAAAQSIFSYERKEVLGRSVSLLAAPEQRESMEDACRRAREGERIHGIESVMYDSNGIAIEVLLHLFPITDEQGGITGIAGIVSDDRERRSMERQLRQAQRMEAIGLLAGGIAHDFNNLLTIIISATTLLLDLDEYKHLDRELLESIAEAGQRAAALTGQLLAFSRQSIMSVQPVDVNHRIRNLEKMMRRIFQENIELHFKLDDELPEIMADPSQIEQILLNLAVNARDAMPTGGILVIETRYIELSESYAETHYEVKAGRYIQLSVSDNGIGMDEATHAHIFDPFFSTKGVGKGTGLGLATVFGIIKQSNGHISCYSEPGRGTTFKVYLPVIEGERIHRKAATPAPKRNLRGNEKILLVEDEAEVRKLAKRVLESHGYIVYDIGSPVEAEKYLETNGREIDLILTDVIMPEMSGRELVEKSQVENPDLLTLYMSGYTDDAIVRHGVLRSEMPFLQKPFTPGSLLEKVRMVLDERA